MNLTFLVRMIVLAVLIMAIPVSASVGQQASFYPFAMCSNNSFLKSAQYPAALVDAGAKMCRVDSNFAMVRKKPDNNPDRWDWSSYQELRGLKRSYPSLDLLPIVGYGPKWAEDPKFVASPGTEIACPQRGITNQPCTGPDNLFGNFVFETVTRYKDVVRYWESWNEPDLPGHYFFKGNGKDFFPYQKACYLAAKQADPSCKVLFAGLCFANVEGYLNAHHLKPPTVSPPAASFFEEYLQECVKDPDARKNNFYFDIMSQHSYSRASDLFDYAEVDKTLMRTYLKEEKPVWFTEMGIGDIGGAWGCTPDEYCDYILQSFAWAKLAGVQRLFHFQLDNSNGLGLYSGMLGSPKPALTTYRNVLTKEFADAEFVAQLHGNRGVGYLEGHSPYESGRTTGYDLFEFRSTDGKRRMLVCFSDSSNPVDVKVPAKTQTATLIDRHGLRAQIDSKDGFYTLHLPGATNLAGWPAMNDPKAKALGQPEHLVGGATSVIIER